MGLAPGGAGAVEEDDKLERWEYPDPPEIMQRWEAYWTARYGGYESDDGELDRATVVERVMEDLERFTSIPPEYNYMLEVAKKLDGSPESLAVEGQIRDYIRILYRACADVIGGRGQFDPRFGPERQAVVWRRLSTWWMQHVLPTLAEGEVRAVFLDHLQVDAELPLHAGSGVTRILSQRMDAGVREDLYAILLEEEVRLDLDIAWLFSIDSCGMTRDEAEQFMRREGGGWRDKLFVAGLFHMVGNHPENAEAQAAATALLDHSLEVLMRNGEEARGALFGYRVLFSFFRDERPFDLQERMFAFWDGKIDEWRADAASDEEKRYVLEFLGMHFRGLWKYPHMVRRHEAAIRDHMDWYVAEVQRQGLTKLHDATRQQNIFQDKLRADEGVEGEEGDEGVGEGE